jgi:hypothetical protein
VSGAGSLVLRQRVVVHEDPLDGSGVKAPILLGTERCLVESRLSVALAEPDQRAVVDRGERLEAQPQPLHERRELRKAPHQRFVQPLAARDMGPARHARIVGLVDLQLPLLLVGHVGT